MVTDDSNRNRKKRVANDLLRQTQKMRNRRAFARIPTRTKIQIRFARWGLVHFAWSVNISKGGMLVVGEREIPVGSKIDLALQLPNDRTIELASKVVRVESMGEKHYQVAVEFLDADGDDKVKLDEALAELQAELARNQA